MPPVEGLPAAAMPLYYELRRLVRCHRGRADSFYYNGFTAIALLATGAAAVLASAHPFVAASLSAIAAFIIALSRALNFGGRWRWHLQRQNCYNRLIYRLNQAALFESATQRATVRHIYELLIAETALEAGIPGSGEPPNADPAGPAPEPPPGNADGHPATPPSSQSGESAQQ